MYSTSYVRDSENVWREILIVEGTAPTGINLEFSLTPNIRQIFYTNGLHKTVTENGKTYNWYIVNAKESIVDNPILVQEVEQLKTIVADLMVKDLKSEGVII